MGVPVVGDATTLKAGPPAFPFDAVSTDVLPSRDGARFLVPVDQPPAAIMILMNWKPSQE